MKFLLPIIVLCFTRGERSLVKQQKVSMYFDHDCFQKFLLLFISLSTAQIVKKSCILSGN